MTSRLIALTLLWVMFGSVGCGKYGKPIRSHTECAQPTATTGISQDDAATCSGH